MKIEEMRYVRLHAKLGAEILKREGYDQAAFEAYLAERLEGYKMPREYYFTDEIPKTFKGSLLRKDIKNIIMSKIEGGN